MIGIYALEYEGEIVYVGQAKNLDRRLKVHGWKYPHLKQHIVCTIDTYDREFLNELEIAHIAFFGTFGKMNKTRGGAGTKERFCSQESRDKQSESMKGRKLTDEHKKKLSEKSASVIRTEEWCKKIGQANKRRTAEQRKAIAEKGAETKRRMKNA